tara:strand:+ start:255 stop:908 length:654 start_codon:yes stop_codon:yes gene_type:complete
MKFLKKLIEKFKKLKILITNYPYYKWVKDEGDEKLLLDYDLNDQSIFFELGGYNGTYSKKILEIFNPQTYIFEPSRKYYDLLVEQLNYPNVKIYNFGLADTNKISYLKNDNDASYITPNQSENSEKIELRNLSEFIHNEKIKLIDLININIEGSEYEVLEDIIDSKIISIVENIQVQYHRNVKSYRKKRRQINKKLSKTHRRLWNYDYVWESWAKII